MPIEAVIPVPTVDPAAPPEALVKAGKAPLTSEQARAARHEAATGNAQGATTPVAGANGTPTAANADGVTKPDDGTASATINMDAETLKQAVALSREAREAKAKAKEAEARAAAAEPAVKAQALAAAGKHLEAIKALGIDLNAAVAETLSGPAAEAEPTAEAKELAKLAAEMETVRAAEAARVERDKVAEAERGRAAKDADVKAVTEFVGKEATKYPYLSRNPAWVAEAYDGIGTETKPGAEDSPYHVIRKRLGRDLNPQETHKLVLDALDSAEEMHVANAKLYGAAPAATTHTSQQNVRTEPSPSTPSARPTTFTRDLRGGTATPVNKQRTRMTFSEAKRARRDSTG